MNFTDYNMSSSIPLLNLDKNCVGDYVSIVIGSLFLLSELLPFYKQNIKKDIISDIIGNQIEVDRKKTFLEQSNGLIHSIYLLLTNHKTKF